METRNGFTMHLLMLGHVFAGRGRGGRDTDRTMKTMPKIYAIGWWGGGGSYLTNWSECHLQAWGVRLARWCGTIDTTSTQHRWWISSLHDISLSIANNTTIGCIPVQLFQCPLITTSIQGTHPKREGTLSWRGGHLVHRMCEPAGWWWWWCN